MPLTSRGKKWEILNSFWIVFTFFMIFAWISFFYIGTKVKQRKWIIWGVVYSLPLILMITTSPSIVGDSFQLKNLVYGSIVGLWAGSIAHALFVRKEYLLRLDAYLNNEKTMDDKLKEQFAREYQVNPIKSAGSISPPFQIASNSSAIDPQQAAPSSSPLGPSLLVDINNDPEETIASLPGVGIILAKKAVSLRLSKKSFNSIEEFAEELGLKPHIVEQLRPLVVINPLKEAFENPGTPGRIIDY